MKWIVEALEHPESEILMKATQVVELMEPRIHFWLDEIDFGRRCFAKKVCNTYFRVSGSGLSMFIIGSITAAKKIYNYRKPSSNPFSVISQAGLMPKEVYNMKGILFADSPIMLVPYS